MEIIEKQFLKWQNHLHRVSVVCKNRQGCPLLLKLKVPKNFWQPDSVWICFSRLFPLWRLKEQPITEGQGIGNETTKGKRRGVGRCEKRRAEDYVKKNSLNACCETMRRLLTWDYNRQKWRNMHFTAPRTPQRSMISDWLTFHVLAHIEGADAVRVMTERGWVSTSSVDLIVNVTRLATREHIKTS